MEKKTDFSYPFTAIVGQKEMKLALCLAAIVPGIGGVLITGERGTAKTTAVRALPALLGGGIRVVELPLNATEDRVVGTLRLDTLMKSGEREFVPGLLAEANGQILYVDEMNLLEDHIVDLLLDSAATGICHIEREGVSASFPARFVLVGTMNPEEGTLRPQLLDRFGLSVKVSGSLTKEERLTLIRRQIVFERDPQSFYSAYAEREKALGERIRKAALLYPEVGFPDVMAAFSSGLCSELGVDGYRGDITMMRAARGLAAFNGRDVVCREDVLTAARLVLPHRMKKMPFEDTVLSEKMIEKAALAQGPVPDNGEKDIPEKAMDADLDRRVAPGQETDGKKA